MKKSTKKLFIIFSIILIIFIILIIAKQFQHYKNPDAIKLENLLNKKGWLEKDLLYKNLSQDFDNINITGIETYGIGKGFDISKINILEPSKFIDSGKSIFKKIPKSCLDITKGSTTKKTFVTTNNTDELVNSISSENNINGSLTLKIFCLKSTVMANTKYDITKYNNIKTSRFILLNENKIVNFINNESCRETNIDQSFIESFNSLPVKILEPSKAESWIMFDKFFNIWGTHVITQVIYGSRFEKWESTIDIRDDIQKKLEAKICLQLEDGIFNPITGGLCSKYSKDEKKNAEKLTTEEKTILLGGTPKTRLSLINKGITEENIEKFIDSAEDSDQPIGFNFTPIWQLYQQILNSKCVEAIDEKRKSPHCDDLQRCFNLEAAYAYKITKCEELISVNGKEYQMFNKKSLGGNLSNMAIYKCMVAKEGCNDDESDCHLTTGGCKAYGPSAFEKGDEFSGNYKTKIRGDEYGSTWDGINKSCNFTTSGCKCDKSWSGGLQRRAIWNQGDSI